MNRIDLSTFKFLPYRYHFSNQLYFYHSKNDNPVEKLNDFAKIVREIYYFRSYLYTMRLEKKNALRCDGFIARLGYLMCSHVSRVQYCLV